MERLTAVMPRSCHGTNEIGVTTASHTTNVTRIATPRLNACVIDRVRKRPWFKNKECYSQWMENESPQFCRPSVEAQLK